MPAPVIGSKAKHHDGSAALSLTTLYLYLQNLLGLCLKVGSLQQIYESTIKANVAAIAFTPSRTSG